MSDSFQTEINHTVAQMLPNVGLKSIAFDYNRSRDGSVINERFSVLAVVPKKEMSQVDLHQALCRVERKFKRLRSVTQAFEQDNKVEVSVRAVDLSH